MFCFDPTQKFCTFDLDLHQAEQQERITAGSLQNTGSTGSTQEISVEETVLPGNYGGKTNQKGTQIKKIPLAGILNKARKSLTEDLLEVSLGMGTKTISSLLHVSLVWVILLQAMLNHNTEKKKKEEKQNSRRTTMKAFTEAVLSFPVQ